MGRDGEWEATKGGEAEELRPEGCTPGFAWCPRTFGGDERGWVRAGGFTAAVALLAVLGQLTNLTTHHLPRIAPGRNHGRAGGGKPGIGWDRSCAAAVRYRSIIGAIAKELSAGSLGLMRVCAAVLCCENISR